MPWELARERLVRREVSMTQRRPKPQEHGTASVVQSALGPLLRSRCPGSGPALVVLLVAPALGALMTGDKWREAHRNQLAGPHVVFAFLDYDELLLFFNPDWKHHPATRFQLCK
jgi:hypothetical protein